jgi:hypothetical protein
MADINVKPVSAPKDLGANGRRFFAKIAKDIASQGFVMSAQEVEWLRSAADSEDIICALRDEWEREGRPLTARGAGGGLVIHPIIGEIRMQQKDKGLTLARIKIPEAAEPASGIPMTAAELGRRGAAARWNRP